jgi:cytochrome c7-like protein
VCHESIDPMVKGSSVLRAFPVPSEQGSVQSLASGFSHRIHLDADKMESATGTHVSCADCHARDKNGDPILPSHKQCLACHDKAKAATAAVAMEKCSGCHLQRNVDIKRGRIFIIGDLKFSHAKHETDQAGQAVACTTCHEGVKDSSKRDDMAVPAMERCAQCHDDAHRSPDAVRMGNCAVCHAQIQSGDPPTNHMVSGALPTDHTIEFRHDHATQAAATDAPCRYCHQVSGRKEDSCFQCHQTMKPRDHNIMFRDDHGREAEADGSRCATCHQPETCAACHSVPPRSHSPLGAFAQGGHAEQARFNLTACLTCHTYATTCAQCHRGTR